MNNKIRIIGLSLLLFVAIQLALRYLITKNKTNQISFTLNEHFNQKIHNYDLKINSYEDFSKFIFHQIVDKPEVLKLVYQRMFLKTSLKR